MAQTDEVALTELEAFTVVETLTEDDAFTELDALTDDDVLTEDEALTLVVLTLVLGLVTTTLEVLTVLTLAFVVTPF